jgi:uncharacterized protein YkwD
MNSKLARFFAFAGVTLAITSFALPAPASASMEQEILDAHNKYRSEVGVPPLHWSNELAAQAKQWANHLSEHQLIPA